ncbi:alpha/beta fold hydrolase [Nocardia goodfellowii]|uniref:Pimeloyl-ACP methyl ester carboxylesterase n=1 Tax=Nocardia goodfellowii TaxID=882446 RepID=A0ABS4QMH3_9NOCA|nr:alpha/beta hydrolase [Nocardia goodfellowii]MBP2192234.1 pimeloyl-ACP methyl ester carboxylesterase [Nocardia goodfellowii]
MNSTTQPSEHSVASVDGTRICYRTKGSGPGLIVVGGALRTADDYLPLATALADHLTVHLVDRRGRGASGPQGPGYGLHTEVADLRAVQAATGASLVFGHSYGGLVALETARTPGVFSHVMVYEPGVAVRPFPTEWMEPYRRRLAADDPYGAFAHFVRGAGGAPAIVAKLPHWYLRGALRVGFRGAEWQRMRPLLAANLAEHEQVAAQYGRLAEFADVTAPAQILIGSRTKTGRTDFALLGSTLPHATLETLPGLDHFGPEGKTAPRVAGQMLEFLNTTRG